MKFLASERSTGTTIYFGGKECQVEELVPDAFLGVDLAIGSTPDEVARDFAPWAIERGASWSTRAAIGGWTPKCR